MKTIKIATRKSPLALWQANYVADRLRETHKGLEVEIVGMVTEGDRLLDQRLAAQGGKGLFLKELEASLLRHETDIAVHSMKDVPVKLPDGLTMAAVCAREDARDAFISSRFRNIYELPKGAKVGTASLRRIAQLQNAFPAVQFVELRGNVNTRLAKLDAGEFDAIILAAAGLIRLELNSRIKQYLPVELCLPAVGQGIMGIECRSDDETAKKLIQPLNDSVAQLCLAAERAMNAALGGGCHVPIGGYAFIENKRINLKGLVGEPDGSHIIEGQSVKALEPLLLDESQQPPSFVEQLRIAESMGEAVAQNLLKQGANEILSKLFVAPENQSEAPTAPTVQNEPETNELPVVMLTRQQSFLGNMPSILSTLGYDPIRLPTIEILQEPNARVDQLMTQLKTFTDVVFVSRNAVDVGMNLINDNGGMPPHIRVMAVGPETAKQLHRFGVDALFPQGATGAEALLNVEQLANLKGRNILLVRGKDGLEWPAKTMRERGATVEEAICYAQGLPENSPALLLHLAQQQRTISAIFIHSANSARNLVNMAQAHYPDLLDACAVVGSSRIGDVLYENDWRGEVIEAESPSNKHMMVCFSRRKNKG